MKVSPIYSETLKELKYGARRVIHQGGQYSGKTVNILGTLATLAAEDTEPTVTTVTSMSFPHLKGGALRDFEGLVAPTFKGPIEKYHKTDHLFTFRSGSIIEFKVFESEMDARGPKRNRLFVNEANKFDWLKFFHLDGRSDQTVIDYNPSVRFWSHEELIGKPGNTLLISDHRQNPFLKPEKHLEIENICVFAYNADGTIKRNEKGNPVVISGDYELWKVYARGLTGNVMGVIFPDWQLIDDSEFPEDDGREVYSIDFGYTNDPTALMKQHLIANKNLFVKELAYKTGLSSIAIKQTLVANGFNLNESVLFCEHDPDMIRQLRNEGIMNAIPARKGPGSVNSGIERLKQLRVFYTHQSQNLHRERGMYVWITDEKTGKLTNVPIDQNNHAIDAVRYGEYSRWLKTGK